MFKGFSYRGPLVKKKNTNMLAPEYEELILYTREDALKLPLGQRTRLTLIQKVDIPVLEQIFGKNDVPTKEQNH